MQPSNRLLVGQIALDLQLLTRDQLQECLDFQAGQAQPKPVGTLLVQNGFLTEEQLGRVMEEQKRRLAESVPFAPAPRGELSFGRLLVQGGHASQERVNEALRAQQDLADRGIRKRLGELLVESGHLASEVVPALLKLQGKALMSCTFCGTHINVIRSIAEGYPCRRCGMPLAETAVAVSAEDTAYLLPPVDPRIGRAPSTSPAAPAPAAPAPSAPGDPERRRRLALVVLLLIALAVAVYLLSKQP